MLIRRSLHYRLLFAWVIALIVVPGISAVLAEEEHGETPHWTYEGAHGPDHWAALEAEYALCGTGHAQSPINLTQATDAGLSDIEFHWNETLLKVLNNGHTIQVNATDESYIFYNGRKYHLLQFHFHNPSEHQVNGQTAPMEVHFVHRAGNDLAVVGVMLVVGDNPADAYAPIFANMPTHAGTHTVRGERVLLADLLPENLDFTTYTGSLTTPPCSEGVRWLVLDTPVALTAEQVAAFAAVFPMNARPVQPLNGRDLLHDVE